MRSVQLALTVAAVGLLALSAYLSRSGVAPAGRVVEISRPGVLKSGSPLYAHPYVRNAESIGHSGAESEVRVARYEGNGAVSVTYEGQAVDVEAPDVLVRRPGGCMSTVNEVVTRRPCRNE